MSLSRTQTPACCTAARPEGDGLELLYRLTYPRARTEQRCGQCRRTIEPGELYARVAIVKIDRFYADTACAHCHVAQHALSARAREDDCFWVKNFWGGLAEHDCWHEHGLDDTDALHLLRLATGFRRQWRRRDGTLMPVPTLDRGQRIVDLDDDGNSREVWLPSHGGWAVQTDTECLPERYDYCEQADRAARSRNRKAGACHWDHVPAPEYYAP